MSLSRVETKKKAEQYKQKNTTNRKRLIWINVALLAIIIVVVSMFTKGEYIIQTVKDGVSTLFEQKENSPSEIKTTPVEFKTIDDDNVPPADDEKSVNSIQPTPTSTTDKEVVEEVPKEEAKVTLAFVGDILQGEYINTLLKEHGYNYPYEKALFSLSSADYTVGNLEMPFTENGVPMSPEEKTFVFKGKPEALSGLVYSGIDLVTLANNHTLDQGLEGLYDTMSHLDEYGIKHIGAGKNDTEAYEPHVVEINGIKVAFLAASWVLPVNEWKATPYQGGLAETYDPTRILSAIEKTKQDADIVVLYVHWGVEKSNTPEQNHVNMAKKYIDAGADIIVGSHAHTLQGFGNYNDKWIAYNLGNFVFSAYPKAGQAETGVLHASCTKQADCELSFVPMKTIIGQPTPLQNEERENLLTYLESISLDGISINTDGTIKKAGNIQ